MVDCGAKGAWPRKSAGQKKESSAQPSSIPFSPSSPKLFGRGPTLDKQSPLIEVDEISDIESPVEC